VAQPSNILTVEAALNKMPLSYEVRKNSQGYFYIKYATDKE
jgi:hypothetical protein